MLMVFSISKFDYYMVPFIRVIRPVSLLFAAALGYWVLNPGAARLRSIIDYWPGRFVLALGVAACGSALFGISQGRSGRFIIENYSRILLFWVLLTAVLTSTEALRRGVWAYFVSVSLVAFIALFISGVSKTTSHVSYDANDVGLLVVSALPLGVWLLRTSTRKGRWIVLAGMAMMVATIPKTESRGTFVGLIVVGLGLILFSPRVKGWKRGAVMVVAVAGMVFAAPGGYWDRMSSLTTPEEDYNWTSPMGRRALALRGLGYMLDNPLFGIGIHNFERAEGLISEYAQNAPYNKGVRWASPHNTFVQAGAEVGIPGLIFFTILTVGSPIWLMRRRKRLARPPGVPSPHSTFVREGTVYLALAFVGFSACGFFLSFAWRDTIYILVAFLIGLMRAQKLEARAARRLALRTVAGRPRAQRAVPAHGPASGPAVAPTQG